MSENHENRTPNRLLGETSPYLHQHAYNPVEWYPWGPEAIELARLEQKPIFLSIGYSACHWCHVMERESFENPDIARMMNAKFINIKVDREERPDLDNIYMAAVQAMTGHGGWPMSVFLTPDLQPFYGGTYYPPVDARGMPGFNRVLFSVSKAWEERRDELVASAGELTAQIQKNSDLLASEGDLDVFLLGGVAEALARNFERHHGGFGEAPKFPHPMDLRVLLREHARTGDAKALEMVVFTLKKMARGGIYDHLGGGFARYSTDVRWLVPHFEKMLYDNALLTSAYLEAYQVTKDEEFATVARETIDYILSRMTDPDGAFYATEDADSEGVEGKYYVWMPEEIAEILGADRADVFCKVYDVTEHGNWEEQNILNLTKGLDDRAAELGMDAADLRKQLAEDRAKLLEVRDRRIPPGKDTKVITAWNGLMLSALAEAAHVLGEPRYLEAAEKASAFLLERCRPNGDRLFHTYKDGAARHNGCLDDYANLVDGLTRVYEASGNARWLTAALDLTAVMLAEFEDAEQGGFFYTGTSHEALIARQRDAFDNATPSGNGMAATALLRLAALTGRDDLEAAARRAIRSVKVVLDRAPTAAGQTVIALDFLLGTPREFAVIGPDAASTQAALGAIHARFLPGKVIAPAPAASGESASAETVPLLADRPVQGGEVTTYICEKFACQAPVIGLAALKGAIALL